jgi:gentisate 1,2-dioxygenase
MAIHVDETVLEEQLYDDLAQANALPLWKIASLMTPEPTTRIVPHIWRWTELEPLLERSGELVPIERGGERRALQLANPGLGGEWATTDTLVAAVQLLLPAERAPAHRHSPSAIRFIMEGEGAYSAVDGERCIMMPGDLVLTPNFSWHDHGNDTDHRVIWMDGLDVPFVRSLNSVFFQPWKEVGFPTTRPDNNSLTLFGSGSLQPTWARPQVEYSPLLVYPWTQTEQALRSMRGVEGSPYDGIALQYLHPHTGGPVLPTIDCWIQSFAPGSHTLAHRHTNSIVYHVHQGSGYSVINGQRFEWQRGDYLVIPQWAWHEHGNDGDEDAVLFSIQDSPIHKALGLFREEAFELNGGRQEVTGRFEG